MYYREPNYEAEQAITNRVNAKTRHCRIGKVRMKAGVPWADKPLATPTPAQPVVPWIGSEGFTPWWQRGPFCKAFEASAFERLPHDHRPRA